MSYRCQECGKAVKPGEPAHRVVTEVRAVTYPLRRNARGDVIDKGGSGSEIVSEKTLCGSCVGA